MENWNVYVLRAEKFFFEQGTAYSYDAKETVYNQEDIYALRQDKKHMEELGYECKIFSGTLQKIDL
jgi:hypothetical protein